MFLRNERPAIFGLGEIKCLETETSGDLNIEGYDGFFKVRTARGGGVALYIDEQLEYYAINFPPHVNYEILGVKVKTREYLLSVFVMYLPLNLDQTRKLSSFCHPLKILFWFAHSSDSHGVLLEKVSSETNLCIANPDKPTNFHITNSKESTLTIDLVITKVSILNRLKRFLTPDTTHLDIYQQNYYHLPIIAVFDLSSDKLPKNVSKNAPYLYEKANWAAFQSNILNGIGELEDLSEIENLNVLNIFSERLTNIINKAAESTIPKAKKTQRLVNYQSE